MDEELKCKRCNSSQVYYRSKKDEFHCSKCGFDFILKIVSDKDGR